MSNIFYSIYLVFKRFRFTSIFIVLSIFGIAAFLVSKIRFEEDITRMLPSDANIQRISNASQNINFMDKLIVNISLNDTNQINPQKLTEFADLINKELEKFQPELIKNINYTVSDKVVNDLYDTFFQNLPIFLEEKIMPESIV